MGLIVQQNRASFSRAPFFRTIVRRKIDGGDTRFKARVARIRGRSRALTRQAGI